MGMAKTQRKGAEEARTQLPALLSDAERGLSTIISRRGRAVAALVPIDRASSVRPRSLLALTGTGRGLWADGTASSIAAQRDEWS